MKKLLDNYFNLIKRSLPEPAVETAIGLDIGSGDCKFVEIRKSGDKIELVNWGVKPVVNLDVANSVKQFIGEFETPPKRLYTSVFGKGTLVRYIDMPKMPLEDLKNSFGIEADKYFPFPKDQIYTDCFILEEQARGKQMSVMAVAAKKELIDERVKILKSFGLVPDFIGLNSIALANVINVIGSGQDIAEGKAIAVFDMGESVSNVTILMDGLPRFSRDVFIGGREFTKRISNALGVDMKEAEKVKRDPGENAEALRAICETAAMNIVRELRLSFDYFMTENDAEVGGLLLTGGGAMLDGIPQILKNYLEIEVSHWNPLGSLEVSSGINKKDVEKKGAKFGVALGLALYDYD